MNALDQDGKTALHLAALKGHQAVVQYLEKKANVNARDNRGVTLLLRLKDAM